MDPHQNTVNPVDRAAIELLIQAIQKQDGAPSSEIKLAIGMLRKYIDSPSQRQFVLAKMAFDELDPSVRLAIHKEASSIAVQSAGAIRARLSAMSERLVVVRKKQFAVSPLLSALDRIR
ncbi:MAG: hypothetical protein WCF85_02805 [Rhodospirillaceae bacterium]